MPHDGQRDVKIEPTATDRVDACFEDYRLLDFVIGRFLVAEWEEHLQTCDICRDVLHIMLRHPFQDENDDPSKASRAA